MTLYTAPASHAPTSSGFVVPKNQMSKSGPISRRMAGGLFAAAALAFAWLSVPGAAAAQDDKAQGGVAAADSAMQEMVLGDPDAPVTITEYASLTCPHCATFHTQVLPELKKEYIDTGKVKLVFRDFPFDRFAMSAAMLARCSGPAKYFPFLDMLFKQQQNWIGSGEPAEVMANLTRLARLAGMDEAAVKACLENEALADYVLNERLVGNKEHGVESTPTFLIGGERYAGVRRMDELRGIIDPLLPAEMKESRLQRDNEAGASPG